MRVLVRLIATLLALAVAATGALLVIEFVWALLRPAAAPLLVPWQAARSQLAQLTWAEAPVRLTAAVAVLVGVLLLLVAVKAHRNELRLHDPAPDVAVITGTRSLARLVGHKVREQHGVAGATVTASRSRVRVRATSEFSSAGDLRDRLTDVVRATVHDLPLRTEPSVSVSVDPARERR